MNLVRTKDRGIGIQRFDVKQKGRVMWATNAGPYNNFLFSIINASKRLLLFNTSWKAVLYLVCVLSMSLLFNLQDTITAVKHNPVAQYFIHLFNILNLQATLTAVRYNPVARYFIHQSWTLSLILLGIYNILTGTVYTLRNEDIMCAHILRLMLGTVWCWFCLMFNRINSILRTCSLKQHTNANACLSAGGSWYGFNISLDIFLMIHCALAISEEVKTYKTWKKLGEFIYRPNFNAIAAIILRNQNVVQRPKVTAQKDYNSYTPIITVIVVCLAALLIMFDFMLVVSVIYNYHMITGNVVAAVLAIVGWYIIYQIWDPICREDDRPPTIQVN